MKLNYWIAKNADGTIAARCRTKKGVKVSTLGQDGVTVQPVCIEYESGFELLTRCNPGTLAEELVEHRTPREALALALAKCAELEAQLAQVAA